MFDSKNKAKSLVTISSTHLAIDLVLYYQVYGRPMKDKLQIRDIVKATGLDRETLRFYESKRLLPKPSRTSAGYREFDSDVIPRIKFIKMAQEVGFSLREISDFLNLGRVSTKDLKKVAEDKISSIDAQIKSLHIMKKLLTQFSTSAMKVSKKSNCPILSHFKNLEL